MLGDPTRYGVDASRPFDLVTLTPPYEEVIYAELVDALCVSPLVGEDTIVVIECVAPGVVRFRGARGCVWGLARSLCSRVRLSHRRLSGGSHRTIICAGQAER